jgi:hypothetical protein
MSTSVLQQETDHYVEKYCVIFIFAIHYNLPVRNIGNKNCVGLCGVYNFVVYGESRRPSLFLEEFGNCSKIK